MVWLLFNVPVNNFSVMLGRRLYQGIKRVYILTEHCDLRYRLHGFISSISTVGSCFTIVKLDPSIRDPCSPAFSNQLDIDKYSFQNLKAETAWVTEKTTVHTKTHNEHKNRLYHGGKTWSCEECTLWCCNVYNTKESIFMLSLVLYSSQGFNAVTV